VQVAIDEPAALSIQINTNENEATINAQGGTAPYQYSVDNSDFQANPTFTGLEEGSHSVTVIDANECQLTSSFTISISAIAAEVIETNSIACNGDETGSIWGYLTIHL